MFVNFSEETQHILKQAQKEKDELNHPYVGSEHLFLSILKESNLKDILKKYGITYKKFKDKLVSLVGIGTKKSPFVLYTPMFKRILQNSIFEAREKNISRINPDILVLTIIDEQDGIAYSILKSLKVNIDKLYYDIAKGKNNKFVKKKKLLIEELGTNLTKQAKLKKLDPVIGRDREIKNAIEILLRRKKNNPILLGPAGVGKTAIVEGIANLMVSSTCPSYLKGKTIISLNIFSLVSGTKYRGEFEEKMKNIIKELEENDDIILFIDEIHTMVGAGGAEGAIDASNIFKPALARGAIKIIGATTIDEYKKFIEPDAALSRRFQKVVVEEPDYESVIKILTGIKPLYESYHNIKITDELIHDIVTLSKKYLTNRFEPDRSIDILDEVCAKSSVLETSAEKRKKILTEKLNKIKKEKISALSNNDFKRAYNLKNEENKIIFVLDKIKIDNKKVTKIDVLNAIKNKGNIKMNIEGSERKAFYSKLENELNECIIGQKDNINKLIKSLKINEISKTKKLYSVLIKGTQACGKTTLANKYLKMLVGEKNVIDIDLSEYKEYHSISKLIGTTAGYLGYDNKNNVLEKVRTNPSSAILIDNFNMACDEVKRLFLKILENGYIEDASGKKIDFSNSIIIFTITTKEKSIVGFNKPLKSDDILLPNKLTSNVSEVIELSKISKEDKIKIINNKVCLLLKNYDNISIKLPSNYENIILSNVNNSILKIDSYIKNNIENQIIENILDGKRKVEIILDNKCDIAI